MAHTILFHQGKIDHINAGGKPQLFLGDLQGGWQPQSSLGEQ